MDTSTLRRTSGSPIPWKSPQVALILIADSVVTSTNTVTEKREFLQRATDNDTLLIAWPGEFKQDVFVIDDRAEAWARLQAHAGVRS
ncbi:MAG: hypothetical protein Q8S13_07045 [Dehalococcoidia bacterium]|nr:hypothetical protein [Dehalococcoidia bacterium]